MLDERRAMIIREIVLTDERAAGRRNGRMARVISMRKERMERPVGHHGPSEKEWKASISCSPGLSLT